MLIRPRFQGASNMKRHFSLKNHGLFRVLKITLSKFESAKKCFWVQVLLVLQIL